LEWEGDKKHCAAFVQKLGVEPKSLSGVQTPGVKIDNEKVESGSLEEDWEILPPKMIKDPEAKKPEDWEDR
jgi:hypothetical protein